jgi:hypothetical protein
LKPYGVKEESSGGILVRLTARQAGLNKREREEDYVVE